MKKQFIETGKITGTHGIRGEVRVQPWSDSPESLAEFDVLYLDREGKSSLKIKSARAHKNMVLMKIDGVDTVEAAEAFRNKVIYLNRDDVELPEGSHFIDDLVGCEVYDTAGGELLGKLCDVSATGANDVWHIKRDGREYLVPAIPDVVDEVDIDNGIIKISPLKGIFDDED